MDSIFTILAALAFGLLAGMIITAFADNKIIRELERKLADSENAPEVIEIRDERKTKDEDDQFKPW